MSARSARGGGTGRSGGYTKDELFGGSPGRGPASGRDEGKAGEGKDEGKDGGDVFDGPLELEHVIGFTGASPRTFLALPGARERFVKAMGSIAVLGDLDDPHAQKLLRAHDEPISALATSVDGSLLASGQVGSTHIPGFAAPVVVWDRVSERALFKLRGITQRVNILEFSDDMRFLAACGEDCVLYVWDATSGEVVFGKRYAKRLSLFQWIGAMDRGRRRVYRLATAVTGVAEVEHGELSFDATRQQWQLASAPVVMPAAGMAREYKCSALATYPSPDGGEPETYLLAGTMEGDLLVMRLAAPARDDPTLDTARLTDEAAVDGAVVAMSFVDGGDELLVGTDSGRTYRLLAGDLGQPASPLTVSHVGVPRDVAFGARADVFASCASDGEVVVWDLSTYDAIATTKRACAAPKGRPADAAERPRRVAQFGDGATCLAWVTDVAVVAGYGDCHVRCFSAADGALEWAIPTAHRRPVSAIACHVEQKLAYLVTGSEDGSVRVWNLSTREVMMQFAEHHKGVTGLVVDAADPRLFHSGGLDCAVFTHDLRSEKRTVSHMMREGAFTGLSQRKDSERELITCDANGRVLFWDCDVPEPILGVSVDGTTVACVAVSPSGRYFVLCRDEMLTIFELDANSATAHPKPIAEGWAHSANVTKVQWSPDERQLVSIGADSCICIWNFFGTSD
ncbi:WD repeat-containing protein [Aureococcus anophagefferens]|nr:WD repeat-containing protein [Aureococcus anophagefferens]